MTTPWHDDRIIASNGLRLRVLLGPDDGKPPLLLLHGMLGRAESWEPVAPLLAPSFRLIAPDLRGHNRSDQPVSGYGLRDYTADLVGLLDELGIETADVVGHSLGGLVASVLAAESPGRVRRVVLEDPPPERTDEVRTYLQVLLETRSLPEDEAIYPLALLLPRHSEEDLRRYSAALRRTAAGVFRELESGPGLIAERLTVVLRAIEQPALLLRGEPVQGGTIDDRALAALSQALPNGRLRTFPDAGHTIHADQPAAFSQVVLGFLGALIL